MQSPTAPLVTIIFVIALVYCINFISCQSLDFIEKQLLCALDKAPCDALGRQIRTVLPEIIQKQCRQCSAEQLAYANIVTKYIQTNFPQAWGALVQKYS
ncbi:Insect pheromone-binding family, A10/OS-D [Popillia japonica]|uniref:Insect pheromone-binding family, A10/OS-D n=1 Tax=Popillia japonica TaxID=7064 RepID=A0AAW1JTX8_POPJA